MRLLFYGDDPQGATGYSRQAKNILTRLESAFDIAVFAINRRDECPFDPFDYKSRFPFKIYRANIERDPDDPYGTKLLTRIFPEMGADILFIMGDIWFFRRWLAPFLEKQQMRKKFKVLAYLSTEFPISNEDSYLLSLIDYPITHSKWGLSFSNGAGYDAIKKTHPNLIYIPDSVDADVFRPLSTEQREQDRASVGLKPEQFVITCVNRNSVRKDIPALIKAFYRVKKEVPQAHLYLHCAQDDKWMPGHETNDLTSLIRSMGFKTGVDGDISFPDDFNPAYGYPDNIVNRIYNCSDLFVSTSVSEGFGITPVEAMFAGVPVLIPGHTGFSNICEVCGIEPVLSYPEVREKVASIPSHPVIEDDLVNRIMVAYDQRQSPSYKIRMDEQSRLARDNFASDNVYRRYWTGLVNKIKDDVNKPKQKAVLFMQHSGAGDVFITTSTFQGLKQRHPGYPIHYMTQAQYQDIVSEHPLVDAIIDYKPSMIHDYEFVYKPHEDKVLRGNWGAGQTPLVYLYSKIIGVKYVKPDITLVKPGIDLPGKYIAVHTTSHPYRTYYNFHIALDGSQLPVIQIGLKTDFLVGHGNFEFIDARGLTLRESAYIIAHASGFVGIDSYPMHVAGVYEVPMVVTFGCGRAEITAPATAAPHAFIQPDYTSCCPVLGPCFGNAKCPNPCGPRHEPGAVRSAIRTTIPDVFPDVRAKLEKLLAGA